MPDPFPLNRRQALSRLTLAAAGGTLVSQASFAQESGAAVPSATLLPGADVCVITPEVTEGPYYFDPALERSDITEGRPGVPTRVQLQVVDAACRPLPGARVDIWHCDAEGLYSGYANQTGGIDTTGQTFMRGTQFTDDDGLVTFATVYPGWYRGRTTHIHFKVFLDQTSVLTGQIFFPDALSEYLYQSVAPYNTRGTERDTLNGNDGIAIQATRASFAYVKELADAYLCAMIVGVDAAARSGTGLGALRGPGAAPPPRGMAGRAAGRGALVPGQ